MEVRMEYYLILAAVMFFAGVYGFITRRNLIDQPQTDNIFQK